MATFNKNTSPSPISPSTWDSGQSPIPNIGAQFFLGCSVIDFTVNADWSSQGGNLTVNLLEDTLSTSNLDYNNAYARWSLGSTYVQKLRDPNIYDYATGTLASGSLPVIGSPQHFRLVDTSNAIVFQYDGILSSISRNASPNAGKIYTVELTSPLKLLENCSILLKSTPGFGYAIEGNPSGISMNGYYENNSVADPVYYNSNTNRYTSIQLDTNLSKDFVATSGLKTNEIYDITTVGTTGNFALEKDFLTQDVGPTFGTNNRAVNWGNVYNLQNVFGIFENESYGLTNYARFGGSRSAGNATKDEGLRLDMIAFALDELINRNADSSPLPAKRYFGGNIISGTTTYNFYDVSQGNVASNPYFFGFDVYSFTTYMINKLGADYIYTGNLSSNLLEFVSTLCSDAGVDFIVELNRIQTSDAGAPNYWDGTDTVSNYDSPGSLYNGGTFHLEKSFTNSVPGGIISIKILDRRSLSISDPANIRTPFSKIAYQILGYEVPDYGDKGLGYINPGDPNPFSSDFESGVFGNTYLDPLDDDYYLKGTDGSSPYGGKFPVVTKADQNVLASGLDINNVRQNASQTTIKLQDNQQTTAKFVVGGKQSRVVSVPQEYIYQYWGDVSVEPTGNECLNDETENRQRPIPVITPLLEDDDVADFIMIDMKDVFGKINDPILNNVVTSGIYCASVMEIRAAMKGYTPWGEFIETFKPGVSAALLAYAGININNSINMVGKALFKLSVSSDSITVDTNQPTSEASEQSVNNGDKHPTPGKKPGKKNANNKPLDGTIAEELEQKVFEKIKFIGTTHYGKSWVVWTPHPTVKVTASDPTNLTNYGQYDTSWVPSNDAYLEPEAFNSFKAPKHTKFMNGARVSNYANYYSTISSGDILIDRQKNYQGLTASANPVGDVSIELYDNKPYKFDFSEVSETDKANFNIGGVHTRTCEETRTTLKIQTDSEFTFVPYDYFYHYNRGKKPYLSLVDTGVYGISYSGNYCAVHYPGIVLDSGYNIYEGTAKSGQVPTELAMLQSSIDYEKEEVTNSILKQIIVERMMCGGNTASVWTNSPPNFQYVNNVSLTENFLDLIVPDNGINCITFTKITTPFVKYPITDLDGDTRKRVNIALDTLARTLFTVGNGGVTPTSPAGEVPDSHRNSTYYSDELHPPCIQPLEVGICQQSTRHHYGPWFTQHNFIYGGKVEYIEDESLVPENFIFPLYGDLSSVDSNAPAFSGNLSGFYGMNLAGQAIANSIDGYGQFASEDGSLTIPGAPLIKRIGEALLNGPYITSLNVSVGAQGITTQYTFNSVTSRSGKTNSDIINKIRRVSNAITKS
jgi:hypothetical protein